MAAGGGKRRCESEDEMTADNNGYDVPPGDGGGRRRGDGSADYARTPVERIVTEMLKRGLEAGRDRFKQTDGALRGNLGDSVFAREVAGYISSQFGDVRQTLLKSVATEVGRYLRDPNFAAEMRKSLAGMTVKATVKFEFPGEDEKGEEGEFDGDGEETAAESSEEEAPETETVAEKPGEEEPA